MISNDKNQFARKNCHYNKYSSIAIWQFLTENFQNLISAKIAPIEYDMKYY